MALTFDCRGKEVPDLITEIERELYENLNIYKRVEGNYDTGPDANDELYDSIFSNKRLVELSKITGYEYARWGTHNDKGRHFGVDPRTNKRVAWGIRFSNSHREWQDTAKDFGVKTRQESRGMKQIRTTDAVKGTNLTIFKPQLVVTVIPPAVYQAITKPGDDGGEFTAKIGNNWRPSPKKVDAWDEWHKPTTVVYPLRVYLPIIGKIKNENKRVANDNVVPTRSSRHYEEMELAFEIDPEVEEQKMDAIIQKGHELGKLWIDRYGPEILES